MSQNFVDYVKDLWANLVRGEDVDRFYEEERKKLEGYIVEAEGLPVAPVLPDAPVYDRLTVESLSDDELKKRVEDELKGYYNSSLSAIDSAAEASKKKYEADKASAERAAKEKLSSLGEAYAQARENTSNDSLKRGLARSSIAVNKQFALNDGEAKASAAVRGELSDSINELDGEISALAQKREGALNDFNIAYAAKLTEQINALKAELEKKQTDALKYNNSLTEKEYSAEVSKTEKESDLYSEALTQKQKENDLRSTKTTDYEKTYLNMLSVLRRLPVSKAREVLVKDPIFKENLNDYYYYMLYNEFFVP